MNVLEFEILVASNFEAESTIDIGLSSRVLIKIVEELSKIST